MTTSTEFSRTLYVWTASDDKALKKSISEGLSVQEIGQAISREPMSVARRISDLEIFEFEDLTEEWSAFMGLALSGVPLNMAIDWCSASEDRLPLEMILGMGHCDLMPAFELARELGLCVSSEASAQTLDWIASQNPEVIAELPALVQKLLDRFEIPTPMGLKHLIEGTDAPPVAKWTPAKSTPRKSTTRGRKRFWKKGSTSTTTRTVYARKRGSRSRARFS